MLERVVVSNPGGPPRTPKASDLLADDLRRRVLGDAMPPGSALPSETQLVETWGFSRATVREALRLLEADGLIRIKRGPGGGITVSRPSPSHVTRSMALMLSLDEAPLRDLFVFRKLVEPAAASLTAVHATPEERRALQEVADGGDVAGDGCGGREGVGGTGRASDRVDLHRLLAEASHNALLKVVHSALEEVVRWHADEGSLTEEDLAGVDRAHRRIAGDILEGNGDGAARAVLRHLEQFEKRMADLGRLDEPIIPRARWRDGPLPGASDPHQLSS